MKNLSLVAAAAFLSGVSSSRTFTVKNSCAFTIWPAIFTDLNVGTSVPNFPAGWAAAAGSSVSFTVPDDWKAGRIWARRNCDFTTNPGVTSCLDGGCAGGLVCTGTGASPATLTEFTLSPSSQDFYDVSLVGGFNLPVKIENSAGCGTASCPVDLNAKCPAALKGPVTSSGAVVGCHSACSANVDGTPANSSNCCTGTHNTPATCPASQVAYYSYFKSNCPNAYAFPYDDSSSPSPLYICNANGAKPNYTITFCP